MSDNRESSENASGAPAGAGRIMQFNDVRFDSRTGELRRGDVVARLTPKAAAVLGALLERAPDVVTKQELCASVWGGRIVGDEALTTCIREVRRALDDDARNPRYIETQHRRGYRAILPPGQWTATALEAPISSGKPSLAVLPFDSLGPDPNQEYFADGIVEDMTTALSRIRSFFVVDRSSSFTFKGRKARAQDIGRQLGVRYIVEGSVRRARQKLRLTAQLIEAQTGHHLWADRYDGEIRDVFDLQDQVVASIVGAISPSIYAAEIERARLKRPGSLQAYDYMLRAHPGLWSVADPGHKEALRLLHKAIELEPHYAIALAQAAWGHSQRFNRVMAGDPESDRRQAIELANAALALAPDDPEVLVGSSHALLLTGTGEVAERCAILARKALTLNPNLSRGWRHLGFLHVYRSDPSQAIDAFERSIRLSPLDPMTLHSRYGIGDAQFLAGRMQEALSVYQQCLAEKPRDNTIKRRVCSLLALTGNLEDAQQVAHELLTDHPHLTLDRIASASRLEAPYLSRYLEGLRRAGFT